MKAISLWQPWATAMAYGVKAYETRHWKTDYRGPLVIHAAKRPISKRIEEAEWADYLTSEIETIIATPVIHQFGCLLCVVRLVDCVSTNDLCIGHPLRPSILEEDFGNYASNRYAWITSDVRSFKEPVPWKGSQGFFDVPDDVVRQALRCEE